MPIQNKDIRNTEFQRNTRLENLLSSLNKHLSHAEKNLLEETDHQQSYPVIFIMGAHRSGTTLFLQWLASLGEFSYPTNLLSRFYAAPIIGAKIQNMLVDKDFSYRDEFDGINTEIDFSSDNGKTRGLLAPNEFWYFWRQFLSYGELDYLSDSELNNSFDQNKFKNELLGIMTELKKPLSLKGMIMNYNITFLNKIFDKAIFIHIKRDMLSNVESMIMAREKQYGDKTSWYSFKIKEYPTLKDKDPISQCTGQYYYINKAIDDGLRDIDDNRKLVINYEDFCASPNSVYESLSEKLGHQGFNLKKQYTGRDSFDIKKHSDSKHSSQINIAYDELSS